MSLGNRDFIALATRRPTSSFRHVKLFDLVRNEFKELTRRVSPQTHHFNLFISPDSSRVGYHKVQKQRKQTRKVQAFSSKHHQLFPRCLLPLFLQLYILLHSADDLKLVYFKAGTSCKNSSHALNKKAMEKSSFRDNSNSKIFSFSMPSKG
ncbi:hypothetical protein ACFX11_025285 [Malus domestica]